MVFFLLSCAAAEAAGSGKELKEGDKGDVKKVRAVKIGPTNAATKKIE